MADLGLCRTPVQRLISYPIHRHRCLLNVGGGEGAREIRGRTLIGRRRGPGGAPCPTISDLFLLAETRLVGKPDFYIAGIDAFFLGDITAADLSLGRCATAAGRGLVPESRASCRPLGGPSGAPAASGETVVPLSIRRPKKRGPFQAVPVIARAMLERLA
jgi:hypothetical protein